MLRVTILAGLTLAAAQATAADRSQVVKFKPGASFATMAGTVKGYDGTTYIVGAKGGQIASILFTPGNRSCYFNVLPPGSEEAIFNGSITGNEYAGKLPADGDYRVQVYLMRSAARRNESCHYTITFEIR